MSDSRCSLRTRWPINRCYYGRPCSFLTTSYICTPRSLLLALNSFCDPRTNNVNPCTDMSIMPLLLIWVMEMTTHDCSGVCNHQQLDCFSKSFVRPKAKKPSKPSFLCTCVCVCVCGGGGGCFIGAFVRPTAEQTVEQLPLIWSAITLVWRQCTDKRTLLITRSQTWYKWCNSAWPLWTGEPVIFKWAWPIRVWFLSVAVQYA